MLGELADRFLGASLDDAEEATAAAFERIGTELDLRGSPFEDATATLPEIPALKTLLISEVQFTADFARALKSLANLRTIVIENAKILELNKILFDDWVKKRMHASISSDERTTQLSLSE